jgi:hypothetical protein
MISKSLHWSCLVQNCIGVTPEGDTVLTMISDDNFSMIQRTLLLQFTLME